ncbi:MAG TPA: hypothetical protein VI456_14735 [Polyangia bacterium]
MSWLGPDAHRRPKRAIAAHFRGTIGPRAERAMRDHLPACTECRDQYDRHLRLAQLDPRAPSPEQRIARGLGLPAGRRTSSGRWSAGLTAAVGLVVVAVVVVLPHAGRERDRGFAARGGGAPGGAEILVYRVPASASAPQLTGDTMAPTDALAFAYRNPLGKRRLMVFGIDEHRHVYWYHPAWLRMEENPQGIAISASPGAHELSDAVTQQLDGEQLSIHALFSDQALTVRDVEQAIARRGGSGDREALAFPGAVDLVRTLRVSPPSPVSP